MVNMSVGYSIERLASKSLGNNFNKLLVKKRAKDDSKQKRGNEENILCSKNVIC